MNAEATSVRRAFAALWIAAALGGCRASHVERAEDLPPQAAHQRSDAGEGATLLVRGDVAFRRGDLDDARQMYAAAAAIAQSEGDVSAQAEALAQTARMDALSGDLERGRPWLERAVLLARPEHPLAWTRTLIVRGVFAREEGRPEEAAGRFLQAFEAASAARLRDRSVHALFLLGTTGEREQRIAWTRRAIDAATAADLAYWLGPLWTNLGRLAQKGGDHELAVSAFEAARAWLPAGAASESRLMVELAYGIALREAGRPLGARAPLTEAHAIAQRRLEALRNKRRMGAVGRTLQELGELDLAVGERERGLERLVLARERLRLAGFAQSDPERWAALEARIAALRAPRDEGGARADGTGAHYAGESCDADGRNGQNDANVATDASDEEDER